jgi:hypothetical protein
MGTTAATDDAAEEESAWTPPAKPMMFRQKMQEAPDDEAIKFWSVDNEGLLL